MSKAEMCDSCDDVRLKTTYENHRYVEGGLPNVVLLGVEIRRCPECGAFGLVLPRVVDLHATIARALVRKDGRLSPEEIVFLRKHLGWSGVDLAMRMGVDPTTVSAWENGRKPFGSTSDRLLRLIVAYQSGSYDEGLLQDLGEISDEVAPPERVQLRPRASGWQISAHP